MPMPKHQIPSLPLDSQETYCKGLKMQWQKDRKKTALISKTKTLHVHHTLLYISLLFLHNCALKMPNFTFYGEHKQAMM